MKPQTGRTLDRSEHVDIYALYEAQIKDESRTHPLGDKPPRRPQDFEWCIAYTGPGMERLAILSLDRGDFMSYCPFYVWRQRIKRGPGKGKTLEKERPVFPSYVFVGRRDGQSYEDIRQTKGVVDVLRVAQDYVVVPLALIEAIRDAVASGCFVQDHVRGGARLKKPGVTDEEMQEFPRGATVRIADGPFRAFLATVVELPAHDRIKVLVEIFGQQTPVELSSGDVEIV